MNLFTNRLMTPDVGAVARSRFWRRLGAGALGAAALTSGLSVPVARADSIVSLQAQARAVASRLNGLDAQMARQDEDLDQALGRVSALKGRVTAARAAVAQAQNQVTSTRQVLRRQAVMAYVQGGQTAGLQDLVQSNASTAALRQSYLNSVADTEENAIDSLRLALITLGQRQAVLQSDEASAQGALDQVRQARAASARAAAAEEAQLAQVNGHLAALVAQVQAQQQAAAQRAVQSRIATLGLVPGGVPSKAGAGSLSGDGLGGTPPPPSGAGASVAVQWAQREIGTPYVYGAAGPDSFDCSGLTMYVWGKAGVSLPHSAAAQWDDTTRVPMSEIQPGDLIFYYQPVDHVGIYVGGGQMIVADHTGTDIRYASIYRNGLDGAGRVG